MPRGESEVHYRADIDGLRAIAVLAVLGFHYFPTIVHGGFIGVDIFFVISGYLISGIVISELAAGKFSIVDFYTRRIRRIFPALTLVLAACFVAGWLLLQAPDYDALARHIVAGTLFVSNLLLLNESSYFDGQALTKPLLHLWSLGVEEQFYILWPLFISMLFFWKKPIGRWIGLFLMVSFGLNILYVGVNRSADFYLPFTRFWELASGGALAYASMRYQAQLDRIPKVAFHIASWCGAIFLFYGFSTINESKQFPGWWAVLPTMSAVLLIIAGGGVNTWWLSNRGAVWFGKISYPLYLWHWVLISFATILNAGAVIESNLKFKLAVLSIALAWLTYRLIEIPVRKSLAGKRSVVHILVSLSLMLTALGVTVHVAQGFPDRQVTSYAEKELTDIHTYPESENCLTAFFTNAGLLRPDKCASNSMNPEIIVIGDSHAGHFYYGLLATDLKIAIIWNGGCYPGATFSEHCTDLENRVEEFLKKKTGIRAVLLAGFPERYTVDLGDQTSKQMTFDYQSLINRLNGSYKLGLLQDVPGSGEDTRKCFSLGDCTKFRSRTEALSASRMGREMLAGLAQNEAIPIFDPFEYFCDEKICHSFEDQHYMYWDGNHLNEYGSRLIAQPLSDWIKRNYLSH